MAFGAFATLLLQGTPQPEKPSLDRLPVSFAKKLVVRGDGWAIDTQIDANHLSGWLEVRGGNSHDHMQPPFTISLDQVSSIDRIAAVVSGIVGHAEADGLACADQRHPHGLTLPIHAVG